VPTLPRCRSEGIEREGKKERGSRKGVGKGRKCQTESMRGERSRVERKWREVYTKINVKEQETRAGDKRGKRGEGNRKRRGGDCK